MIEIKFVTADGDKHLGLIPTHVASSIQDVCELIGKDVTLQQSAIYGIKQADIADVQDITDEDKEDGKALSDGAYYKSTVKYMTIDGKVAKYVFLVWAEDLDDAKARTMSVIDQNSLEFAELVKIEKTKYTAVMDYDWFDKELEVSAICADGNDIDIAKSLYNKGDYKVEEEVAVDLLLHVRQMSGRVEFKKICPDCDHPMYYDRSDGKWICKRCANVI